MEHDFPWLPIGTEIIEGAKAGKLLGNGNGYQLIAAKDDDRVILLINKSADLLSKDEQYDTLNMTGIEKFSYPKLEH